ncbi:hypothetical protein E5Q_04792 [Mixia osmundae IAM 14324]|uniref:Sterol regulatory element-binding protein cleavage-activating protein n=1 Tax=Mixia osmundae (strain CBS 9802 / IAM 14324 / JCM 22182 / KY 12970) TaxID=764103 RepID=G7E5J9_MIXOS|nr:hypothetical protein E5Q_04792 [Mixia osmundae IAM 14324]
MRRHPRLGPRKSATSPRQRTDSRLGPSASRKVGTALAKQLEGFAYRYLAAWGRYVARSQIKILLLVAFAITSLLYPALYATVSSAPGSTQQGLYDVLSRPIHTRAGGGEVGDLALWWDDIDDILSNQDEACWKQCPRTRTITIEQILVTTEEVLAGRASEHGALDLPALHSLMDVQAALTRVSSSFACIGTHRDACLVLTPLDYWNQTESTLLSDDRLLSTLLTDQAWSARNTPMAQAHLLTGRHIDQHDHLQAADYLALTYFTSIDGLSDSHIDSTAKLGRFVKPRRPSPTRRVVLKFRPLLTVKDRRGEEATFIIAYLTVGMYCYLSLRRLDRVHSRTGLVLTGIVEMLASGALSMSVCTLFGVHFYLVPWKLIPFLILVLGVDSIFVLTNAVSSTSIDLPVPERVAQGLGQVGLSIFVTLFVEISLLLGVYVLVPVHVVREIVVFGSVALLNDYILQMTFFVTVLSIDLERLEMADLLRQGSKLKQTASTPDDSTKGSLTPSAFSKLLSSFRQAVLARGARAMTAALLVLIDLFLYARHGPGHFLPDFCAHDQVPSDVLQPLKPNFANPPTSSSEAFWRMINPGNADAVHVFVQPHSVFALRARSPVFTDSSLIPREVQSVLWTFLTVYLLPVTATASLLYLLLLYLLKDKQLLQARDRYQPLPQPEEIVDQHKLTPVRLRRAHRSDIELVAIGMRKIASWAVLEPHIVISDLAKDTAQVPRTRTPSLLNMPMKQRPISIAISDDRFCACLFDTGSLVIYNLGDKKPLTFQGYQLASVVKLTTLRNALPPYAPPMVAVDSSVGFFAASLDGSLSFYDCEARACSQVIAPALAASTKVVTMPFEASNQATFARVLDDRILQIWRRLGLFDWHQQFEFPLEPRLHLQAIRSCVLSSTRLPSSSGTLALVGYDGHDLELYEPSSGRLLRKFAFSDRRLMQLATSPCQPLQCSGCGATVSDGMHVLLAGQLTCILLRIDLSIGPHTHESCVSAGGSLFAQPVSSPASPRRPRAFSSAFASDMTDIPLSNHGLRRLSHAQPHHLRRKSSVEFVITPAPHADSQSSRDVRSVNSSDQLSAPSSPGTSPASDELPAWATGLSAHATDIRQWTHRGSITLYNGRLTGIARRDTRGTPDHPHAHVRNPWAAWSFAPDALSSDNAPSAVDSSVCAILRDDFFGDSVPVSVSSPKVPSTALGRLTEQARRKQLDFPHLPSACAGPVAVAETGGTVVVVIGNELISLSPAGTI